MPENRAAPGFRLDIQGLRAIAVGAVLLYHAHVPFLRGGYVGVDIFFVISGFLITSHLLTSLLTTGRISFASFYAKRARRILPASFVVLTASFVSAALLYPPLLMGELWRGAVATALYIPNLFFASEGTNYLAETTPSVFQHYWSLGIEEQFYLVWPAVLALVFAWTKSRRALLVVVTLAAIASFAACVLLTYRSQPWAFFSLPTRAWELAAGGLLAFILVGRQAPLRGPLAAAAGWFGLAVLIGSVVLFTSATPFPSYWAAVPVVGTLLVILGGASTPAFGPAKLLSTRSMVFVGTISYSLYLVHWPVLVIPETVVATELPLWLSLLLAAACVPLAWLSYRFVETPGIRGTWLSRARPRRTLLAAAAASLVLVIGAVGVQAISTAQPLYITKTAPAVLTAPPAVTSFVPDNLRPSLRTAGDDRPELYAEGCHRDFDSTDSSGCTFGPKDAPRIALFGDSHAAQWFPALDAAASAAGYAVETFTKSSCPSVDVEVLRNNVPYTNCTTWRAGVIDRLEAEPPALVIIANYGTAPIGVTGDAYVEAWSAGLASTLDQISAPTAVMADTPNLGRTPAICLSVNLTDAEACGLPRSEALDGAVRDAEASTASEHSAQLLNLTDYMCSPDLCPPIVGDTLIYQDAHHITATFSEELSAALWDQLAPLLK